MTPELFFSAPEFLQAIPNTGILMGIDLGDRTTGLALSDPLRKVSSPCKQIEHKKLTMLIKEVHPLVRTYKATGIVLGLPLNMDGTKGPRAHAAIDKAQLILEHLNIPLFLFDERLSTQAVDKLMIQEDLSRKKRKERKDKLAATYILQSALDLFSTISN